MKVYEIVTGKLYQRGSISKADMHDLISFTRIFNVRTKEDPFVEACFGGYYRHWPLPDGKKIPVDEANAVADQIAHLIDIGEVVLVYCNAGRNRSSLVNALVLRHFGFTGAQAVAHIKKVRPGAFGSNEAYAEYVESLP